MSQAPTKSRTVAGRTGIGLALVSAMTVGTAAQAVAAPAPQSAAPRPAAPVAPAPAAPSPAGTSVLPANPQGGTYTVQRGDTVWGIAGKTGTSASAILAANGLSANSVIHPGQTLRLSGTASAGSARSAAAAGGTYTVQRGDTVWGIAGKTGSSVSAILAANGLSANSVIQPGQTLRLSGSAPASTPASNTGGGSARAASSSGGTYTVQRGDTVWGIAGKTGTSAAAILAANGLSANSVIHPGQTLRLSGSAPASNTGGGSTPAASSSGGTYTVQRGDTVWGIAGKTGTSAAAILAANGLSANSVIYPGQTLRLSGLAPASSSTASAGRVGNTFLGRTYSSSVVSSANANARALDARAVPSRAEMQAMVRQVAVQMGVDPSLALAHAQAESSFNHRSVSPANAVGVMQVIPSSGEWASQLVGRQLDLLDPRDNVVAGVAIIRQLHRMESNPQRAIAGYYQGLGSVRQNGMFSDTRSYVNRIQSLQQQYR